MEITKAISAIFLITYCPSKVGTNAPSQETSGSIIRTINVVTICTAKRTIDRRSSFEDKKSIPIITSNNPNKIINTSNVIKGIVVSSKLATNGFAGLNPTTFKIPNQKYTTKIAIRAIGKLAVLHA